MTHSAVFIALLIMSSLGIPGHVYVGQEIIRTHMKPFSNDQLDGNFLCMYMHSSLIDLATIVTRMADLSVCSYMGVPTGVIATVGQNSMRFFYLFQLSNFMFMVLNRYTSIVNNVCGLKWLFNPVGRRWFLFAAQLTMPAVICGVTAYAARVEMNSEVQNVDFNGTETMDHWPAPIGNEIISVVSFFVIVGTTPFIYAIAKMFYYGVITVHKRQILGEQIRYLFIRWVMLLIAAIKITVNGGLLDVQNPVLVKVSLFVSVLLTSATPFIQLACCRRLRKSLEDLCSKISCIQDNSVKDIPLQNRIVSAS